MEGHCVGQLTDASVVLRFGYQAIRRAGLPTEEILTLSLIHISEPTRPSHISRMPSSA